jgi:hypothetical protein
MGGRTMNSGSSDRSDSYMEYEDTEVVITERIVEVIRVSDSSSSDSSDSSRSSRSSSDSGRSYKKRRFLSKSEQGDLVLVARRA